MQATELEVSLNATEPSSEEPPLHAPLPSLEEVRMAAGALGGDEAGVAAVARLAALGFAHDHALAAYLACGRNEIAAADFLHEHL